MRGYSFYEKGKKILFIIIDGLGDVPSLEYPYPGKTPLEVAYIPNINSISRRSKVGLHYPFEPGVPVGSGLAHILLFGYDVEDCVGRGVFEALGMGVELDENTVAYRINFCTVDKNFVVIDRRAGRSDLYLTNKVIEEINEILERNPFGLDIKLYKGKEHRGVLIIKDERNLMKDFISRTDPGKEGLKITFGDKKSKSAEVLKWITEKVYEFLDKHEINEKRDRRGLKKINCIIMRGGDKLKNIKNFNEKYNLRACAVADGHLYLGVAKYVGMDVYPVEKDEKKIETALDLLYNAGYDFCFVHFKKVDEYGHDGDFNMKRRYLEFLDRYFMEIYSFKDVIFLSGDHATPCCYRMHTGDLVPFLIYVPGEKGDDLEFNEKSCRNGSYGIVRGKDIMKIIMNKAGRFKLYMQ